MRSVFNTSEMKKRKWRFWWTVRSSVQPVRPSNPFHPSVLTVQPTYKPIWWKKGHRSEVIGKRHRRFLTEIMYKLEQLEPHYICSASPFGG